jgi:hypothetical protein
MKLAKNNSNSKPKTAKPPLVVRAERSFRRIARQIKAESRRLGVKPVVFK